MTADLGRAGDPVLRLAIPAAAHGQPRSAFSRVEVVNYSDCPAEVLEFFDNTPKGRAALLLVCIQLGPRAARTARNLIARLDGP